MKLEQAQAFIEKGGFHDFLQMNLTSYDAATGGLVIDLPFRDEYARLPKFGDYHGGIIASVLDVVGTFTAALKAQKMVVTSNLRTDFLRNPAKCDLTVRGSVVRAGRTQVIVDVMAYDPDGRLCAVARGCWVILQ